MTITTTNHGNPAATVTTNHGRVELFHAPAASGAWYALLNHAYICVLPDFSRASAALDYILRLI